MAFIEINQLLLNTILSPLHSSFYPVQIKEYSFSTTYWTSVITAARHNQAKNTGNTDKLKKNGKETNVDQIIYHLCHVKATWNEFFFISPDMFFHRMKCEVNPLDIDKFLKCVLQHLVKNAWLYITSCLSQRRRLDCVCSSCYQKLCNLWFDSLIRGLFLPYSELSLR